MVLHCFGVWHKNKNKKNNRKNSFLKDSLTSEVLEMASTQQPYVMQKKREKKRISSQCLFSLIVCLSGLSSVRESKAFLQLTLR